MNDDSQRTDGLAVSVVVPCYNEEGAITDTMLAIQQTLLPKGNFEIIAVNDGSSDNSGAELRAAAEQIVELSVIDHVENRGYGAALKTGITAARGKLIAITDADGTYPNDRLPDLIDAMAEADMVVGARIGDDVTYSKIRAIPKVFLRAWVTWISRNPVPDINSGLRVFRRDLALRFLRMLPDTFSFTTTITLLMFTNYHRVKYIPISYQERIGSSKIKPIRDTLRFTMLIARTGTYFAPARVLLPIAGLIGLAAAATLGYDIWLGNLTDKTIFLSFAAFNTTMFALLADMIDKRTKW